MNGFTLAKKILRAGYFWRTMEIDCIKYVQQCHQCQIHADMIGVPPNKLNTTTSPLPFSAWGMDVIGPFECVASNWHRFILVAIDYFTKWVEATSYKAATKKHEKLPITLLGYCTTLRTSTGATPYLLVYGTEAVIPAEVEIPSLKIIQEDKLSNAEWVQSRYEQPTLVDRKRMNAVFHSQLYQNIMATTFNKKGQRPRQFTLGQLVLKRIFTHQDEAKGKFSPNWQGPYMVH
ncbi:uncharacterized protein [Nicotiana sylvestris]|uniref:uncharacterized protein n=1 Tax=Nicotiana sylvestris TaxID=4096 RepID=UPI00388C96A1